MAQQFEPGRAQRPERGAPSVHDFLKTRRERGFSLMAPPEYHSVFADHPQVAALAGPHALAGARIGHLQAGERPDHRAVRVRTSAARCAGAGRHDFRLMPIEDQNRFRDDTSAFLHLQNPGEPSVLADLRQFPGHRIDRSVRHRRRLREPRGQPVRKRCGGDARPAGRGLHDEWCRKRQQGQRGPVPIAYRHMLRPGLVDLPDELAVARLGPGQCGAMDVVKACAAGLDDFAHEIDQDRPVRPRTAWPVTLPREQGEPAEKTGILNRQVSPGPDRVPFETLGTVVDGAVLVE